MKSFILVALCLLSFNYLAFGQQKDTIVLHTEFKEENIKVFQIGEYKINRPSNQFFITFPKNNSIDTLLIEKDLPQVTIVSFPPISLIITRVKQIDLNRDKKFLLIEWHYSIGFLEHDSWGATGESLNITTCEIWEVENKKKVFEANRFYEYYKSERPVVQIACRWDYDFEINNKGVIRIENMKTWERIMDLDTMPFYFS